MKANVQKKKITGNGFLLLITIALFVVMYVAGMIVFADKGFAKPQMFLNLFVSNADRKSTRLNSSHIEESRMPSSA